MGPEGSCRAWRGGRNLGVGNAREPDKHYIGPEGPCRAHAVLAVTIARFITSPELVNLSSSYVF